MQVHNPGCRSSQDLQRAQGHLCGSAGLAGEGWSTQGRGLPVRPHQGATMAALHSIGAFVRSSSKRGCWHIWRSCATNSSAKLYSNSNPQFATTWPWSSTNVVWNNGGWDVDCCGCDCGCDCDCRAGYLIIQKNIRSWCTIRNWGWYKLFGLVRPLVKGHKADEEAEKMAGKFKEVEEQLQKEEKLRKELEEANSKLIQV